MKCENCGTLVADNIQFCPECGSKIEKESTNTSFNRAYQNNSNNGSVNNRQFGNEYQYNDRYQENNAGMYYTGGYSGYSKKNSNKTLLVILIILMIILISFVSAFSYFAFIKPDYTEDISEDTPRPTKEVEETPEVETPPPTETAEDEEKETEKPSEENFYEIYKSDVSWEQANSNAESYGGHLLYINNRSEFEMACRMADENNLKIFWIGARRDIDDSWSNTGWLDGSSMSFTSWCDGEPSYEYEGELEDCLMVFKKEGVWSYNDSPNTGNRFYKGKTGYIVEYEE